MLKIDFCIVIILFITIQYIKVNNLNVFQNNKQK